jgi:hypothetical protein
MSRFACVLLAAASQALVAPQRPLLAPRPAGAVRLRAAASLSARFNNFGLALKDRSRRQRAALGSANLFAKLPRALNLTALSVLFVAYRAYRGFFVLLPAVYGEVYAQALAQAEEGKVSIRGKQVVDDIDPATGRLKLRSRIVINIAALAFLGPVLVAKLVGLEPRAAAVAASPAATPAENFAAKERELDLPPLPDIPDALPDTDDAPLRAVPALGGRVQNVLSGLDGGEAN